VKLILSQQVSEEKNDAPQIHYPDFALVQLFFTVQKDMLEYVLTIAAIKMELDAGLCTFCTKQVAAAPAQMQFDRSSHL
jgi:hypothetical protein